MDNFRIEYNLHKDGSWVSDGFNTREEAECGFIDLKETKKINKKGK